jgi:hypothetical protein
MSWIQRIFAAVLPRRLAESMEADSRSWMVRCSCGFARSIWELGGIRWKAAGQPRQYLSCPQCGPALLAHGDARAAELGDIRVPLEWKHTCEEVDWDELSALYLAAPLGNKSPANLRTVFSNSMYKCFVYEDGRLVGIGRALADGADCSYISGARLPE